jgi:hypothetical protein
MSQSFWLAVLATGLWVETALAQAPLQKRCGWFSNPTPGNLWLRDADGEWLIGAQGGYQTPGDWPWPAFGPQDWVTTNSGDYGYGCACFELRVDPKSRRILEIKTSQPRPLGACRQDPRLSPLGGKGDRRFVTKATKPILDGLSF